MIPADTTSIEFTFSTPRRRGDDPLELPYIYALFLVLPADAGMILQMKGQ